MPSFDTAGFCAALHRVARARGVSMEVVAEETGVPKTTLSRMKNHGTIPDGSNLAALGVWAGLNPAQFSGLVLPAHRRR